MKRSDINPMPSFFDRYIKLVDDEHLGISLEKSFQKIDSLKKYEALGDRVYQPGKWTVKDILQHIIDTERIMSYRALRFARKDKTLLPGFDEDLFANNANASKRTFDDLLDEMKLVRQSSILLFKNLDDEALIQRGIGFKGEISVLALGFVICGHPQHHTNVIDERYWPLLTA